MPKQHRQDNTIILITSGFEEESTVFCLKQLRQQGLKVDLVGLTAHSVTGAYGIKVKPDYSLGSLENEYRPRLVVIPGGRKSAETLLADPRIHRLVAAATADRGYLAVLRSAEPAFVYTGMEKFLSGPNVVIQSALDIDTFISQLVAFITRVNEKKTSPP
jgi:hypothetical protein